MPTYEYACTQCGQHIEVFQHIADASLTTCGACGGALRKVFHPAGIMFKGSGFYSTDKRSKSKTSKGSTSRSEGGGEGGGGGGGGGGEGGGEKKAEASPKAERKGEKPATSSKERSA